MPGLGKIVLDKKVLPGETFTLNAAEAGELLLWRPRAGEAFTVVDAEGALIRARLASLTGGGAVMTAFESAGELEKGPEILLLQALPDKERFELVIGKTTELGVTRILPFKSEKSISLEELDSRQKRSQNWQDLAVKASKQSRRWDIPRILPYSSFGSALAAASDADLKVIFWERPGLMPLRDYLGGVRRPVREAAVMVGPEGGFTDEEAAMAKGSGFVPLSAGQRILRTETAAVFGVGVLRYELGG